MAKTFSPPWLSWRWQTDTCRGQRAMTGEGLLSLNLTAGCHLSSKSHKVKTSTSACSKKTATLFFLCINALSSYMSPVLLCPSWLSSPVIIVSFVSPLPASIIICFIFLLGVISELFCKPVWHFRTMTLPLRHVMAIKVHTNMFKTWTPL